MHESFHSLLISLERERAELFSLLRGRSDESLNAAPGPGQWSAVQVMHHLIVSEELALSYLHKKLSYTPKLEKAGFRTWLRKAMLKFYLALPIKFKAPKVVSGEVLPEFATLAATEARWEAVRADLSAFLTKAPAEYFDKELFKHPFAGKLTLGGMLEFFLSHFRRHREQIIRGL